MKIKIAMVMMLALLSATGCQSTNVSSEGGIVPINEEFSITVPSPNTVKQGTSPIITLMLNRGAYFKRDVQLDIKADGISVTPSTVLVKASDKPDVQLQIAVSRDAAIGDYRVSVTGTPETGAPTSTAFIVKVVAQ
jgi:hypothetical protein